MNIVRTQKKLIFMLSVLLFATFINMNTTMKVHAAETCKQKGKYLYEVDVYGNAIFMGYTGTEEEWTIPSEIAGRRVTTIGGMYKKKTIHYKNAIKTVKTLTIPGTVEHIDAFVFNKCINLEKVVLQDGMSHLDDFAFSDRKSVV